METNDSSRPGTAVFVAIIGWITLVIGLLATPIGLMELIGSHGNGSDFQEGIAVLHFGSGAIVAGGVLATLAGIAIRVAGIEQMMRRDASAPEANEKVAA